MYARLLGAALAERSLDVPPPSAGQALAEVVAARSALYDRVTPSGSGVDPSLAFVQQLAYDVALVRLATLLRVQVDLEGFRQPQHERAAIEDGLRSRGIRSDWLDETGTTAGSADG